MAKRILVVDDEPDARELVAFHLERAGYEVLTAGTVISGLEQAVAGRPDLVVLDLLLPDGDGFALCEQLREDPRTRRLPVLILTAFSSVDAQEIGRGVGADDYLVKPFRAPGLLERIRALLATNQPDAGPARKEPPALVTRS